MVKIIGIGFIGIVCYQLLKNTRPDIATLLTIVIGVIILIILSENIAKVINVFSTLSTQSGLSNAIFSSVIKIIGIGYITEYSANVCIDADCSSIAKKIELGGKLTIFIMALPIINEIIDIIGTLV